MAKKKTILTEDAFNAKGNPVVTQDILNESADVDVNTETEASNDVSEEINNNNDKINGNPTDDVQKDEINDSKVESESKEADKLTEESKEQDSQPEEIIEKTEKTTEEDVPNNVMEEITVEEKTEVVLIGRESCHDELYYIGDLV